jgi:SAM-dependent methyltransferase
MTNLCLSKPLPFEQDKRPPLSSGAGDTPAASHTTHDRDEFASQTVLFYDGCTSVYDHLYPDHLMYSNRLFASLVPLFQTHGVRTVLDAGCGVGHDMSLLLRLGYEVDGLDISPAMISATRRQLLARGFSNVSLQVGDVRKLRSTLPSKKYDLVLFRGNALSNIQPCELPDVVEQLLVATRAGGLLCLDYRNGWHLFQERRRFEFRGVGYDDLAKQLFVSFYRVTHARDIDSPYRVVATIIRSGLAKPVSIQCLKIYSHYVRPERVLDTVRGVGGEVLPTPHVQFKGLPCLETVIAFNRRS